MIELTRKLVSLGGFLRGSKSALGVVTLGFTALQIWAPQHVDTAATALQWIGISLLPIGLSDKALRK
jgi:hypothetical protein